MASRLKSEDPPRRRGRPRQFEHGSALDAALKTFWTKGYAGASLDDLTTAMDLNKPSVYAAFGNKEALYAAAVDHYVATLGKSFLEPLATKVRLADGLEGFYAAVIDCVTGRHGPHGCIVACTLPAEAESSPAAREQLAGVLATIDEALAARFAAARASGELPAGSDPKALAQLATNAMLGISIRARGGASRRELTKLARTFVSLVTAR